MFQHIKLSTYDVVIVPNSSNGEGKFTLNGWDDCFQCALSLNLHYWVEKNLRQSCAQSVTKYVRQNTQPTKITYSLETRMFSL